VLRWDGSSWTVADGPRRGSLQTVWAGSDTAAWAAAQPFEHWNGSGWRVVSVDAHDSNISDAGGRPGVVWAVGSRYVGVNQTVTTILRRDASGWHLVDSPSPGSGQNDLGGVATVPGGGSWAVGSRNGRSTLWNALIEHIC